MGNKFLKFIRLGFKAILVLSLSFGISEVVLLILMDYATFAVSIRNFPSRAATILSATPDAKLPAAQNILSYGDSINDGYLLSDISQTYSKLIEKKLNERNLGNLPFRVSLMPSNGGSPSKYYLSIRRDFEKYAPKLVITEVELSNDLSDEALLRWTDLDKFGFPQKVGGGRYRQAWPGGPTLNGVSYGNLFDRTAIYSILSANVGLILDRIFPNPLFSEDARYYYYNVVNDRYFITQDRISSAFDRMFKIIAEMQQLAMSHNSKFLLLILPSNFAFYKNQFYAGALELVARAEQRSRELGISFLSLTEVLGREGGKELFFDFCHPKPSGHQVIAHEIWSKLGEFGIAAN